MKVAVPDWQGRVSPVFDVAEHVQVVDLDDEEGRSRVTVNLANMALHDRARRLAELGVDVLVCGAISWPLAAFLTSSGIRVIPLVCGRVEEIVQAFRDGTLLDEERFIMPGCCQMKRRRTRGRRRGGAGQTTENVT